MRCGYGLGCFRVSGPKQELGAAGEKAAGKYLRRCGYKILDRNFSCPLGEIDLICYHDDCIVFVEVKTLADDAAGDPEERITRGKQKRLARAAHWWIEARSRPDCAYRFDAVSVVLGADGRPRVRHIMEAFVP